MPDAYIGLGSNLDNPHQQILHAVKRLAKLPETKFISRSSIYQSPALGDSEQPDYLNTAVRLETTLQPLVLLDKLQAIEKQAGRVRVPGLRWQPRCIDLDILLYGDQIIQHSRLQVPHSELHKRNFVVLPLLEIAPKNLSIPGIGSLEELGLQWQKSELPVIDESTVRQQE